MKKENNSFVSRMLTSFIAFIIVFMSSQQYVTSRIPFLANILIFSLISILLVGILYAVEVKYLKSTIVDSSSFAVCKRKKQLVYLGLICLVVISIVIANCLSRLTYGIQL